MRFIKNSFRSILKIIIFIFKTIFKLIKGCIRFIHRKKRYSFTFYGFLSYVLLVVIIIKISGDSNFDKTLANKRIDDVTQLNATQVGKIVIPETTDEIVQAIQSSTGTISIGGGKFSMGGQTSFENSLHLDLRSFNKVLFLDKDKKQVTVQSGIVWRDLQKSIDPENLSIKIMQTYANFTVGGSLSVNCHGRYIGHGPIISSVLKIKLVTASGEIITASRSENTDIFNSAIGGYGGIGVITEVTLQLVENVKVERKTKLVEVNKYNTFFNKKIKNDSNVIFQNGDLYPPNYDLINNVAWVKTDKNLTDITRVTPENNNYWLESKLVEVVSWGDFGKWLRKKIVDPIQYSNEKIVWRNKEASYDVAELEPKSRKEKTYVLQEYFIPVNNIESFIPKMKKIYDDYNVNIINVSLRHAYPDKESFLSWANEEVFAFVIYYKQGTDSKSKENVKQWTIEMTDAILSENGKWYLPYQPHATIEQFKKGFPNSDQYFSVKDSIDPLHRFNNQLLDKYNPYLQNKIEDQKNNIKNYFRDEQQTFLTVPEWYLVFNPKEYAEYLEAGKNPSNFPFYKSINEYWKLYDKSLKLVSDSYSKNEEYETMLKVIGVSITLEYTAKLIYENTIGKLFHLFSSDTISEKEKTIVKAQRAYSDFIYQTAWYEFEFMPWIKKVWSVDENSKTSWLRKWERTLLFTIEFSFKACYAELIEFGAKMSYEEPTTDIFMLISAKDKIIETSNLRIVKEENEKKIIAVKRWEAFTDTMLNLFENNIQIHEIGGNDEIVVSILLDKKENINFKKIHSLYLSEVVTNPLKSRNVCLIYVTDLFDFIRYAKENSIEIEHIFDY